MNKYQTCYHDICEQVKNYVSSCSRDYEDEVKKRLKLEIINYLNRSFFLKKRKNDILDELNLYFQFFNITDYDKNWFINTVKYYNE